MHREPAWPAVLNRRGAEVREREAAVSTALLPRIGIDTSTASSDIVVTPQEPEQTAETQEQTTQVYGQDRVPSVEQKAQNRSSSQLRRGPPRPDSLAKYGGRLSTPDASIDLHDSLGNIIRQQHNGLSLMRSAEPHFAAQMRRLQSGTLRESLVREFDRSDGDGNVLLEFVYKEVIVSAPVSG